MSFDKLYFPYEIPRPGQLEMAEDIIKTFDSKKFAVIECPTGSGKSAIAYTVAKHFDKVYYLTSTKILQTQLENDFGDRGNMAVLKGRSSYKCQKWPGVMQEAASGSISLRETIIRQISRPNVDFNCSAGFCKLVKASSACDERHLCQYWMQVEKAKKAWLCVMNFDSFLYQTTYSDFKIKGNRNLIVIDEAQNSEGKLLDFITLTISDRDLDVILEERKTAEEYYKYFNEIKLTEKALLAFHTARACDDIQRADRLENLITRLALFNKEMNNNWVCNFIKKERYRAIEIKPLFVRKFANDFLFSKAQKVLMMSATILSPSIVMDSLGVKQDDFSYFTMPSSFPVKNRPIYLDFCGSMSFKNKVATFPKMIKKVDEICDKYKGQRGIIHTHNFEIAELLMKSCKNSRRFTYQRNFSNKEELMDFHRDHEDSIIVAPSMHEGISLDGELSRMQIICKIPYPNQNDNPQLKKRTELSWNYYTWLVAIKLVQGSGRSIRSETDWADTYIIDSDFAKFLDTSHHMLPEWFLEAIVTD